MRFIKQLNQFIVLLLSTSLLISCQLFPSQVAVRQSYLEFDEGISQLANSLMIKLQKKQGFFSGSETVLLNPFLDIDNGQVLQVSLEIEKLIIEETHKHFKNLKISRITPEKLATAQYILNGLIKYEAQKINELNKYYQVSISIVDLKKNTIATAGTVWISSEGLDYQPTPSYEDNPMYIKGKLLEHVIKITQSQVGAKVDADYYAFIKTKALLVAAQTAYDNKNYELAHHLSKKVVERENGKIIEAYGNLYIAAFKLGYLEEAEKNFGQMIAIGIDKSSLPIKFLFQSNLTEFLEVPKLKQQYAIWVRQISLYFKNHPKKCVDIVGHSSKYGKYDYNKQLSKKRAKKIQLLMSQTFPDIAHQSKTIGKGSDEIIVGTIPDSTENAIDRRVEFKIIDCEFVFF
ncbi:OmpA family protein [Candidatus Parabeggiatoa sp. HSG14]|uniref:OmpA family protein n=1 Tax=Candidatus Parabeggiatoa sp. HSG14 TaxID=3055593 RepID=UPI0025A8BD6F|nr:OmpA family protein [Thiotrichales bacterium HSG14]